MFRSLFLPFLAIHAILAIHHSQKAKSLSLRDDRDDPSFLVSLSNPLTRLRICNAYDARPTINVFDKSLVFGNCIEDVRPIRTGDSIDFFSDDKKVLLGSFKVESGAGIVLGEGAIPPQQSGNDRVLLLVIQPADGKAGVAFQSHVYGEDKEAAQLALLDGVPAGSSSGIGVTTGHNLVDIRSQGQESNGEKLVLGSVVSVKAGEYELGLDLVNGNGRDSGEEKWHSLSASQGGKYSIIRVEDCGGGESGSTSGEHGSTERVACKRDIIVFPSFGVRAVLGAGSFGFMVIAHMFLGFKC